MAPPTTSHRLLTNVIVGDQKLSPLLEKYYFGHCQSLFFHYPSISYTMRSSKLYGPVTKATAGKYFGPTSKWGAYTTKKKGNEVK